MKTTVDLPDPLFRKAKATAAQRGLSLKSFITQAVEQSLSAPARPLSALLASLPEVPAEAVASVRQRLADADAADLALREATRP